MVSTTSASYRVSARRPGRVTVTVRAGKVPTGRVVVRDLARGGRVVAQGTLTSSQHGVARLRVARLGKGKHRLVAQYAGSTTVRASQSPVKVLRLR